MATVDVKGMHRVQAKGRTYYYAWRGGPRLPGEPGSPAFIEALAAAHATRKGGDAGRISGLCAAFRASPEWRELSDKSREAWSPWIDRIQVKFGELRIAQFDRPEIRPIIRKWRDKWRATPRAADMGLSALSRLMSFAQAEGQLQTNPVSGIPRLYSSNRADVVWTQDDLDQLAKTASASILNAARLAAFTGIRQGDLLRLSWSHVKAHSIEIPTGKSKRRKTTLIPLHKDLRDLLDDIRRQDRERAEAATRRRAAGGRQLKLRPTASTVLTTTEGLPWATGFGASWQKAVKKAGIDKHFHDLRGTAATRLYLADLSIREIAEIMTWSEDRVSRLVDAYVKRDELLKDRIRRMDRAAAEAAKAEAEG